MGAVKLTGMRKKQESTCGHTSFGGYSGSPSCKGCQYVNKATSSSAVNWFTKTFAQWGRLTLPVLLSVEMKTESRAPQAIISTSGSRACGLVPHVPCPTVLSSM